MHSKPASPSFHASLFVLLALLAPTVWATGLTGVLKDTAIADFSDEDMQKYLVVVNALLDAPMPAAPVDWSNPSTGVGAHLEVIGQPQIKGFNECRRVRTHVYSRKHRAQARTWTACRDADGTWRLAKGN